MFVWCPPSINSKGSWRETTLFYIILWMKKPTVYILHLDLLHKILLEYFFFDRKPRDQSSSSTSIPRILIYYLQLLGYLYHRGVVHVRLPTTNVQLLTQFLLLYIHKNVIQSEKGHFTITQTTLLWHYFCDKFYLLTQHLIIFTSLATLSGSTLSKQYFHYNARRGL